MHTERPYQTKVVQEVWGSLFDQGNQSTLLQCSTGAGKTHMATMLIGRYLREVNRPVVFLAHRREIVDQTVKRLTEEGIPCGAIMSGRLYSMDHMVQVGSVDTFDAWITRGKIDMPEAGLLLVDETHRIMGKRYTQIADAYRQDHGCKLVGLTATPIRSDGVGLGRMFESMVCGPSTQSLIDDGYLVPVRYKVGIIPDVSGVKLTAGDYNQAQLEAVMDQKLLIGDVVENWTKHGEGRPTMAFCSGVKHSQHLAQEFIERGIKAEHIDASTSLDVRAGINERLLSGETKVVCNAQVYVEGTDIPWIGCIILAKPTKSIGRYLQEAGRGLRPFAGKTDLVLLDHAGNVHKHGRIEMNREWRLTEGKEMVDNFVAQREKERVEFTCKDCGTIFHGTECPTCARKVEFTGVAKNFLAADLADLSQAEYDLLTKPSKKKPRERISLEKREFYRQLLGYAAEKKWKRGWAYHQYIERFKTPPEHDWYNIQPGTVSQEVRSWIVGKMAQAHIARSKNRGGSTNYYQSIKKIERMIHEN